MKLFSKPLTEAERLFNEIAQNPQEKGLLDIFSRQKNYVNINELSDQGHTLNWQNSRVPLEISLRDFWDTDYNLFERAGLDVFNLFRITQNNTSDKKLGEAKAIYQYADGPEFFLEYVPKVLRDGASISMPRKSISLKQDEKKLILPKNNYLLKK